MASGVHYGIQLNVLNHGASELVTVAAALGWKQGTKIVAIFRYELTSQWIGIKQSVEQVNTSVSVGTFRSLGSHKHSIFGFAYLILNLSSGPKANGLKAACKMDAVQADFTTSTTGVRRTKSIVHFNGKACSEVSKATVCSLTFIHDSRKHAFSCKLVTPNGHKMQCAKPNVSTDT